MSENPQASSCLALHELLALHKLILSADFGSWLWDPQTGTLYVNAQYLHMLGYSAGSFPQHVSAWENLIHPEDREAVVQSQRAHITDPTLGDSFESRYRLRTASGEYMRILGRGFVMHRDAQGIATRISGMHISLDALDAAVEQEALQHERMVFAFEACGDGLWDWNTTTEEVYFSPRYASMLGYTPETFSNSIDSWTTRVHPDDYARTVEKQYAHAATPANGDLFECVYRFLAADGAYRWILGRGKVIRRNLTGQASRIVGLHTDITELRNVQDKLTNLLNHDALTQLYSRYYFDAQLDKLNARHYPVSVIYVDVDGLKLINDNMGHAAGDSLLRSAAQLLRQSLPEDAIAGRIGGDEFAVLLPSCPAPQAERIAEALRQAQSTRNAENNAVPVYMTLGLVTAVDPMPAHKLMARADQAMLANKHCLRAQKHAHLKTWIEKATGQPVNGIDARTAS